MIGILKKKYNKIIDKVFQKKNFNHHFKLFSENISSNSIFGEYGCGRSTSFVLENFNIPIYSVDSSEYWVKKINDKFKNQNLYLNYVNIGNVGINAWGRPDDYSLRENFIKYAEDIWKHDTKPNVVLIDGRLRVLCFLVSLKNCDVGTKIIFDDYVTRKFYHVVEEIIKPTSIVGRQALFKINEKNNINLENLDFLINKFNFVLD